VLARRCVVGACVVVSSPETGGRQRRTGLEGRRKKKSHPERSAEAAWAGASMRHRGRIMQVRWPPNRADLQAESNGQLDTKSVVSGRTG
jgi:hypothetical protein